MPPTANTRARPSITSKPFDAVWRMPRRPVIRRRFAGPAYRRVCNLLAPTSKKPCTRSRVQGFFFGTGRPPRHLVRHETP